MYGSFPGIFITLEPLKEVMIHAPSQGVESRSGTQSPFNHSILLFALLGPSTVIKTQLGTPRDLKQLGRVFFQMEDLVKVYMRVVLSYTISTSLCSTSYVSFHGTKRKVP
jgi:hypothetical protein